jgi:NADP-dependent 3-hydroxy acid dehydrogenase YdfG
MRPEHPIALITGAASDFGEATARLLAAQGYHLAMGARRIERLQTLAVELSKINGVKTFVLELDIRSDSSVAAFTEGAVEALV